jgi:hypothetical protein
MFQTLPQNFRDKIAIEPNSGCWLWTGAITEGYARAYKRSHPMTASISVHKFVYELFFPPVKELHHICETKCCVNPKHLQPVTRSEHRMLSPSRYRNITHCINGHPFSEENTYLVKNSHHPHGARKCKTCAREWWRRHR